MGARLAGAALGIWLMAAPAVLGYGGVAGTIARVLGPIAATIAIVAASEVTRPVRWCNVAVGAVLVASVVVDHPARAAINHALVGAALGVLATVRGRIAERTGGGWAALRRERRGATR